MLFSLLALPLLAAIFPNVQAQAITPGSIPGRSALDPPSTLTTKTSTTSTCTTIVNLGLATDLPSCFVYDGATYRDVCPVKHSELEQCPWLCTSSLFMNRPYVCSLTDLSNSNEFTFCQDCLTGSKSKVALTTLSPVATTKESWIQAGSMSASTPLSMPTANAHRTSTCTSITSVTTKLPSCFIYDGYLYRTECPVKHSEREQCPWLCQTFLFNGPPFICSPSDVSGPNPIEFAPFTSCKKCLPFSNSSAAAVNLPPAPTTVPSTADKMTAHTTAATCTSIKPSGTDPPAVKALQNGISYSYRFSCGRSAATVTECPYLCDRGPSNHTLRLCDKKDVSDPTTVPINSRLVCESCSLPRETPISSLVSSSSVVPSATCTSTSSTGTLCPLVKHHTTSASTSPLFQSRCGTTAAEIADCPFLCTTVDPAYIDLFRCVNADVSGKNTIFDEYHIESCVKCLPACS